MKVAKFQSVKNKAPCKRLSHICALSRPLPGSVGVVGAVAKLTYFAIKTVAPGNFLSPRGFSGRQCWEDGRRGNMADTDKKGGVLRGFPKPAWQAVFSGVWSKEKKQGTYFKIGQTYFKISQTYFFGPENPFQKCLKNADKNRRPFARGGRGDYSSRKLKLISSPENIMRVSCARVIAVKLPACALLRVHCPWLTV